MISLPPVWSVAEQMATQLRGEVLSGGFRIDEPLREVSLARRFGVSRATVRKVLQELVQEGLLVAKRNCGVTVAPPPSDTVRELLIPMRVTLETYALRACFDELSADDFRVWSRLLGQLRLACEEGDHSAVLERDFDFHHALLLRAGQSDLVPLWKQLLTRTMSFYEHARLSVEELPSVHAVHVALLDVFRSGDKEAAVEALAEHIRNGEFNAKARGRWRKNKTTCK